VGRNYERLEIEPFGEHLLRTGDLDPVYIALHKMQLEKFRLGRWLLSYWCFYHVGQACYMAGLPSREDFWGAMEACARNALPSPTGMRWQRGHERRHFRGLQGTSAVDELRRAFWEAPEAVVEAIKQGGHTYPEVAGAAMKLRSFGPWISFKVADMLDRCTDHHVSFTAEQVFDMFESPREAALILWRRRVGLPEGARPKDEKKALMGVYDYLHGYFRDRGYAAPPKGDRQPNVQEIETILCKWKSHLNGHYPLNNDITEINAGLQPWLAHSAVARAFRENMPVA
jgi:hypothetical protein